MLGLDAQIEHWERVSAQCDGMTSNVCAKLDALDARLSSLAAALIPLHEETETLSYVQSNAAAALEEMDKIYKKYEDAEVIRDTLVKSRFPVQSDEFLQLLLDAKMLLDYFKQNSHNEGSDRTVTALRLSLRRAEKECRATLAAAIGNIPLQYSRDLTLPDESALHKASRMVACTQLCERDGYRNTIVQQRCSMVANEARHITAPVSDALRARRPSDTRYASLRLFAWRPAPGTEPKSRKGGVHDAVPALIDALNATYALAEGERALMETVLLQTAADLRTHAHAADQSAAPHILAVATDEAEAASIAHSLFLQVVEPALTTLLGVSGRVLDALQRHATVPRQLLQLVRAAGDVLDRLPHLLSALQGAPELCASLQAHMHSWQEACATALEGRKQALMQYSAPALTKAAVAGPAHPLVTDTVQFLGKLMHYQRWLPMLLAAPGSDAAAAAAAAAAPAAADDSEETGGGDVHPLTRGFLLDSLAALERTLERLAAAAQSPVVGALFQLVNVAAVWRVLSESLLLRAAAGDRAVAKMERRTQQRLTALVEACWRGAAAQLKDPPEPQFRRAGASELTQASKTAIKQRFLRFNAAVDEALAALAGSKILDDELRRRFHQATVELLLPAYEEFHARFAALPVSRKHVQQVLKYSPATLRTALERTCE